MTYFLDRIATHLYDEFSDRLDRHCLVFPNRRAGLYFMKYLASKANRPIWAPEIKTINELFQSFSPVMLAESEILVLELYKRYRELNKEAGSIDDFFFWGEMLVNDFDDIDKYLIDPSTLFVNLKEIKDIDIKFGGLTEEQIGIIKQFWVNFNPSAPTDQKTDFIGIWSVLYNLYCRFRNSLNEQGLAYEGMIYRELAEKARLGKLEKPKWDYLHFIGFNALNNCEKVVMSYLKETGKARFYWDYDDSFVTGNQTHSAGFFIRENLKLFGNDMPSDWNYSQGIHDIEKKPFIQVIDSSSDIAQVKLAAQLLADSPAPERSEAHHTAIVLADENLLLPALTSLPANVESINITMGYPLKFSPVYSLIKDLLTLQKNLKQEESGEIFFEHRDVKNILTNSFFNDIADGGSISLMDSLREEKELWISGSFFKDKQPFNLIFSRVKTAKELSEYLKSTLERLYILADNPLENESAAVGISIRNEFIYRVILAVNRLEKIIADKELMILIPTYCRLLDRILRSLSIPFYGEPLNGIQIMGILETRSLDFRNLIILSVNEGVLPQNSSPNSFIPFNLREAYGLPTLRHQDSIYAYYFYRLLQRAEKVTLIYNSSANGLKTGEMSRFIQQLKYSDNPPLFKSQRFEIKAPQQVPREIRRESWHNEKLKNLYLGQQKKILSPSAVNMWLSCRMKFFYRYVCGIAEPDKVTHEIDPAIFGRLLHSSLEQIYLPFIKKIIDKELINSIVNNDKYLDEVIASTLNGHFHNSGKSIISGKDQIICNILKSYIKMIIRHDSSLVPLEILEMEYPVSRVVEMEIGDTKEALRIGGVIDRLDRTGGICRITDYKTGNTEMEIPSVESLFEETEKDRNESWFQIFMYCSIFLSANEKLSVRPSVYPVRSMNTDEFADILTVKDFNSESITIEDFSIAAEQFEILLMETIRNIFNAEEPFRMTEHLKKCSYCPFVQLCQR